VTSYKVSARPRGVTTPPGPLLVITKGILASDPDVSAYESNLGAVGRRVDIDQLLDANGVADLLGLAHRNTVSVYQHRYADMPRPLLDLSNGRTKLWLRPEVERWAAEQAAKGRTRPARRTGR
jgi:hypothetical protein